MISTQTLKGNLVLQDYTTAFTLNQGDKGVPFRVELLENGTPYTLLSDDIVTIEWLKPNGNPFLQEGNIKYATNYIEFTTPESVAQYSGTGTFNIIITNNNVRKGTIRREYRVVPTSMKPGSVSEDTITDAITELRELSVEIADIVQNNQDLINNNQVATQDQVNTINANINTINTNINTINSSLEDITNDYAKKTEINELASNKANQVDLDTTNVNVSKNTTDIATQSARIDTFTNLSSGSTTGDAELLDARIVNGTTYTNVGGAVRALSSGEALGDKSITGLKLNSYIYNMFSKINSKNLITNPLLDDSKGDWYFENGANYSPQTIENVKTLSIPSGGYAYTIFKNFTVGQIYYVSFKYFVNENSISPTFKVMAYKDNVFVKNVVNFTTPCKINANIIDRMIDSFTAEENIDEYRIVIDNSEASGVIYASQVIVTTDKNSTKEFFTGIKDEKIYMDDYKIGGTYNSLKLIDNAIELTCTTSDIGVLAYRSIDLDGIDKSISFNIKVVSSVYPLNLSGFFLTYKNGVGTSNPFDITVFENGTYKMEYNGDLKGVEKINCGINSPLQNVVITLSNFKVEDKKTIYNPLIGKKITANGDSIMQGVGYAGGFAKLIAKRNNMAYENIAIGGGTIAKGTTTSTGTNRHWICDTVTNMDVNADYAIFDGGINDFWNYVPIGTLTNNYTAEVDNTTFYGALEYLFRTAYTHFSKNTKILYVVQHNVNDIYYLSQNGQKYAQFHEAILKTCAKYSIPVVDLFENGRFNTYLDKYKALCANSDGVHPNEQGYNLYYVPQIEAKLKNL